MNVEERNEKKLKCVSEIKRIATEAIEENNLTEEQVRKTLGIEKYEKC